MCQQYGGFKSYSQKWKCNVKHSRPQRKIAVPMWGFKQGFAVQKVKVLAIPQDVGMENEGGVSWDNGNILSAKSFMPLCY